LGCEQLAQPPTRIVESGRGSFNIPATNEPDEPVAQIFPLEQEEDQIMTIPTVVKGATNGSSRFVKPLAPPRICITCQRLRKYLELKDRAFIELFPVGQQVQISKPF
jgi:hypothetical protein